MKIILHEIVLPEPQFILMLEKEQIRNLFHIIRILIIITLARLLPLTPLQLWKVKEKKKQQEENSPEKIKILTFQKSHVNLKSEVYLTIILEIERRVRTVVVFYQTLLISGKRICLKKTVILICIRIKKKLLRKIVEIVFYMNNFSIIILKKDKNNFIILGLNLNIIIVSIIIHFILLILLLNGFMKTRINLNNLSKCFNKLECG